MKPFVTNQESYIYKFYSHTLWISSAMSNVGHANGALWDEKDGFFYDLLHFPDGSTTQLKIRSLVGLLPLMSVRISQRYRQKIPLLIKETGKI